MGWAVTARRGSARHFSARRGSQGIACRGGDGHRRAVMVGHRRAVLGEAGLGTVRQPRHCTARLGMSVQCGVRQAIFDRAGDAI